MRQKSCQWCGRANAFGFDKDGLCPFCAKDIVAVEDWPDDIFIADLHALGLTIRDDVYGAHVTHFFGVEGSGGVAQEAYDDLRRKMKDRAGSVSLPNLSGVNVGARVGFSSMRESEKFMPNPDSNRSHYIGRENVEKEEFLMKDDPVNSPRHYRSHPSGVEVSQITEHMGCCRGEVVKYVRRADHKGNAIEDLKKAAWYLTREIERRESGD